MCLGLFASMGLTVVKANFRIPESVLVILTPVTPSDTIEKLALPFLGNRNKFFQQLKGWFFFLLPRVTEIVHLSVPFYEWLSFPFMSSASVLVFLFLNFLGFFHTLSVNTCLVFLICNLNTSSYSLLLQ